MANFLLPLPSPQPLNLLLDIPHDKYLSRSRILDSWSGTHGGTFFTPDVDHWYIINWNSIFCIWITSVFYKFDWFKKKKKTNSNWSFYPHYILNMCIRFCIVERFSLKYRKYSCLYTPSGCYLFYWMSVEWMKYWTIDIFLALLYFCQYVLVNTFFIRESYVVVVVVVF